MGLLITTAFIVWFHRSSILHCHQNTTLFLKNITIIPFNNSDDTEARAYKASFPQAFQLKHETSLFIASCVIMAFCSFASLVGGTCGPSPENPNVVHFVDLKNCDRDVKAHLKFCNILTDVESVNSESKLLLARAGK